MWIMYFFFFFFKQKTAYELRKGDWSSDVCSSDLSARGRLCRAGITRIHSSGQIQLLQIDRKSVVWGKSVLPCVDFGGRRIIKKKKKKKKKKCQHSTKFINIHKQKKK